jgi:hypothetical protein
MFTPDELRSHARRMAGQCWRVVEAQHVISTLKLVDTLAEQAALERLLDASKPAVPPGCRHLHYLLSTPFRYGAPYPRGSRFRPPGATPGVFYASRGVSTAVAELAFHRLLFFAESPDTPWPVNAGEHTAFSVRYRTPAGVDLSAPTLDRDADRWRHVTDYEACQALATTARAGGMQAIRYRSVRDPGGGLNVALLTCAAFQSRSPLTRQTWRLHLSAAGVAALCDSPRARLGFDRSSFAADPRIAGMRWERG